MTMSSSIFFFFFFFNDTATTEIYTLSLHDALPISTNPWPAHFADFPRAISCAPSNHARRRTGSPRDRKSTRLNSSHGYISYAVFCLKKKKKITIDYHLIQQVYGLPHDTAFTPVIVT